MLVRFVCAYADWFCSCGVGIIGGVQQALVNVEYFPTDNPDQTVQTGSQSVLSGVLVASLLLGAFLGCFVAVWLANKKGLRFALRIAALDCVVMSVCLALAPNFWLIVVARTLLGMSIGFAAAIIPWYVTDAIPAATRGSIGTIFQINICAFILVAEIVNYVRPKAAPRMLAQACRRAEHRGFLCAVRVLMLLSLP